MITHNIERLTPYDAVTLLKANHVNRNLREGLVLAYREDMEAGRWVMTGETIVISDQGTLLDGQHRLSALAGSNLQSLEFMVIRGLPESSQLLMDQGTSRNITDMIKLAHGDVKNATIVSSIARWLHAAPEPGPKFGQSIKGKISAGGALVTFKKEPDTIIRAAENGVRIRQKTLGVSAAAIGYCWYHFEKISEEECFKFYHAWTDLAFHEVGDPRKAAYVRIAKILADPEQQKGNWTSVACVSVMTRAWNMWRDGVKADSIMIRMHGAMVPPVKPL